MRRKIIVGCVIAIASAAAVCGQLRDKPAATTAGAYRVTPWPNHGGADQQYEEEVQEFLNRMAADGWRYHSDLVGQFGKLMIFERDPKSGRW